MPVVAAAVLSVCMASNISSGAPAAVSPDVLKDLAPTGKIRAAINLGNMVLVQKNPADGQPKGITPELAKKLAERLGVPLEVVIFDSAGKVFDAAPKDAWDIAFLAIEPVRAADIEFTAPYVIIDGTYMVPASSPLKAAADVDAPGKRIAVGKGAAYDLYLTRNLKHAALVRGEGGVAAHAELCAKEKLDAVAGVREALIDYAKTHSGMRVMDDKFMEIRQAMGTPKGRIAGARYLGDFVEEMKASGFVADALRRSGQSASVAPPRK